MMKDIRLATGEPLPDTGLHVVFLGTKGGPPPTAEATGISTAVLVDGKVYLVDVGRAAVTQYVRAGLQLRSLRGVFITHLHADHIADYFNLFLLGGNGHPKHRDAIPDRVAVFGPGPAGGLPEGEWPTQSPDAPTPGLAALTDLAAQAYAYSTNVFVRESGIRLTRDLADVTEIDVSATGAHADDTHPEMEPLLVWEDGDVRISAVLVPHGPVFPAFAYRIDSPYGSVTLSGDTTYSTNLERLAAGTDLLVHEAINIEGAAHLPQALREHLLEGHVEVQKVGGVAQRAGAKRLVLSHVGDLVHRVATPERWEPWAQQGYAGPVHLARDLEILTIAP
jgi:ribonuclease BN (tRNA processing enzyme)